MQAVKDKPAQAQKLLPAPPSYDIKVVATDGLGEPRKVRLSPVKG